MVSMTKFWSFLKLLKICYVLSCLATSGLLQWRFFRNHDVKDVLRYIHFHLLLKKK